MNKRGVSHIEIVISVVLFLAFVGLALFFFSPGDTDRLVDTTLIYAFDEVISRASEDIESYSVILECSSGCEDVVGISITGVDPLLKVSAVNGEGVNLPAERTSVDLVSVQRDGNTFFSIMFGENFLINSGGSGADLPVYTLGASDSKKIISKEKIEELVVEYNTNYLSLKKDEFNLPDRIDFEFELDVFGLNIKPTEREKFSGGEVFGKTERVEVINENGETSFGDLTIRVW